MALLTPIANILKVVVGLGFVIFLHELGHFLLAKWNGVKVEKFSIGFGPALFGFRRGETEYVLAAVPLGGFVKMLGEGEGGDTRTNDPRAYPNQSVWARMAIISAGVFMNLLLGFACFTFAFTQGVEETPAEIGVVMAGSPAYEAGIRPGDEVVAIDGRRDITFMNLKLRVALSGKDQVIHLDLKRPGHAGLVPVDLIPRRERTAEMPTIGIVPSEGFELGKPPYIAPPGTASPPKGLAFQPGDTLVAAGPEGEEPQPLDDILDYHRLLARYRDRPLVHVVERDGRESSTGGKPATRPRITATLPPNHFVDFGFRLTIEPISAIQAGSIAEKAGFRPGDVIVKVNDEDFDPMRLPSLCLDQAGQTMTFEVQRHKPDGGLETKTLTATPDATQPWVDFFFPGEPLKVPGLGLAYPVRATIKEVVPDSPAARAGLKVGDVINSLAFTRAATGKPTGKTEVLNFSDELPDWPRVFAALQTRVRQEVLLTVNNAEAPIRITPEADSTWFHPLRGLRLLGLVRALPPQSLPDALRRGFHETVDNILSIYATIWSLVQGRVSPKGLAGPIGIAEIAYASAGEGLSDLIHFFGMLSINLAVLNFLPIPPLDGGQMVYLLAEKVRGRPLPESALSAGMIIGMSLLLCLIVFVFYQDIARIVLRFL
ncbi:MAG: site-2 protease family protein [Planctomycetaceae bacterium]|nr:site-2 protease family protein [Planctomycetaceae bacterium]